MQKNNNTHNVCTAKKQTCNRQKERYAYTSIHTLRTALTPNLCLFSVWYIKYIYGLYTYLYMYIVHYTYINVHEHFSLYGIIYCTKKRIFIAVCRSAVCICALYALPLFSVHVIYKIW